jgi:hypothetical protein
MLHVTSGGLDDVWNEVMPTFQLNVDLRPCVVNLIAKPNQGVIYADNEQSQQDQSGDNNQQYYSHAC